MKWVGIRETGSNWLIDVKEVSVLVPGVWVLLEGLAVSLELVWSILVEESNLGSASWTSGEPENERIVSGVSS